MVFLITCETDRGVDDSCCVVLVYSVGYVQQISMAPESPPARTALPLCAGLFPTGAMAAGGGREAGLCGVGSGVRVEIRLMMEGSRIEDRGGVVSASRTKRAFSSMSNPVRLHGCRCLCPKRPPQPNRSIPDPAACRSIQWPMTDGACRRSCAAASSHDARHAAAGSVGRSKSQQAAAQNGTRSAESSPLDHGAPVCVWDAEARQYVIIILDSGLSRTEQARYRR